jgi:hypothetical protein
MNTFQLVWTKYGDNLAIGIRNLTQDKFIIEQIYNIFYNYGVTGGSLYIMNDSYFGYFLIKEIRLKKIKKASTDLGKQINLLIKKDFVREDFLKEY